MHLIQSLSQNVSDVAKCLTERVQMAFAYYSAWKVNAAEAASVEFIESKGMDIALNSLERHLQATALIISELRAMESLANGRAQLSHECKAIFTCWEWVESELQKMTEPQAAAKSADACPVPAEGEVVGRIESNGEPLPLYGTWEPQIEDEILEADLEHELVELADESHDDGLIYETREQRLARKKMMVAQSKRLYSELQQVLQAKAAEWKERETRVMKRLGKTVPTDPPSTEMKDDPRYQSDDFPLLGKNNKHRPLPAQVAKFNLAPHLQSNFNVQASLAFQVRALASQRVRQHEDVIGESDETESSDSTTDAMDDYS